MPDANLSTTIRDYVTSAAVLTGGGWALWRWGFEERLRRHRDFPSLDGEMRTVAADLQNGTMLVTVNALWRNRGKLPLEINTAKTFLDVYYLDPSEPPGPISLAGRKPSLTALPLSAFRGYILEPNADSVIQQCLILPSDRVCLMHWRMCSLAEQKAYPYLEGEKWWIRYHVWSSGPGSTAGPGLNGSG